MHKLLIVLPLILSLIPACDEPAPECVAAVTPDARPLYLETPPVPVLRDDAITPRDYGPTSAWVIQSWNEQDIYTEQFSEMVLAPIMFRDPLWSSCTLSFYSIETTSDEWAVGLGCSAKIGWDYVNYATDMFQKNGGVQVLP